MATFRATATLLAAVTLVNRAQAWVPELPICTSPFQPFVYSGCYSENTGGPDTLDFRSQLPTDNMTVELCVADCKGNGFRFAGLEYGGECFCGQTVDGPKADEADCTFTCNGDKGSDNPKICGAENRLSIYQDPTFPTVDNTTIADYNLVGCWTDESSLGKALGFPQDAVFGDGLTTEKCLQACKNGGFPFAGTEYGGECYCGVVLANGTAAAPDSECDMACNGNADQTCGGRARLSLYVAHDLESLEPCGYVSSSSSSISSTTSTSSSSSSTSSSTTTTTTSSSSSSSTTSTTSSSTKTTPTSTSTTCTTSSSTKKTSTSTSTTCTTSTKPVTVTPPPVTTTTSTTKKTSTTTTSSICTTTTVIPPTCEYKCGNWCSSPLPDWSDNTGCKSGQSNCALQVSACFKNAGWPGAMSCFDFHGWCNSIGSYCGAGGKSKSDCLGKNPPQGGGKPTTSTITVPCKTTSTVPTTTSTKCPIPTPTGICTQPSNSKWGYGPGNAVGGIELPSLTCNDLKSDFAANPFKLYTDVDSTKCSGWGRGKVPDGCAAACKDQYDNCIGTYAQGCKDNSSSGSGLLGWLSSLFNWKRSTASYFEYSNAPASKKRTFSWSDSYDTATSKCKQQYQDCLNANKNTNGGGKCGSWGSGW